MPRFKCVIAYDGTNYSGWQIQPKRPSIEGTLLRTIKRVFGEECWLLGASRTDAGVHALGQVFACDIKRNIDAATFKNALNNSLPADITIRSVIIVGEGFHPHANVLQKTYYYHVALTRPLPHVSRYAYFYRYPIDVAILREALSLFRGTQDFRSFCTGKTDRYKETVRTIDDVTVEWCRRYKVYRISFSAERFMYFMIRRLVGAALAVANIHTSFTVQNLSDILQATNPEHSLPKAPAGGLMLRSIHYRR